MPNMKWLGKTKEMKEEAYFIKKGNATEMSSTSREWELPEESTDDHIFDI